MSDYADQIAERIIEALDNGFLPESHRVPVVAAIVREVYALGYGVAAHG